MASPTMCGVGVGVLLLYSAAQAQPGAAGFEPQPSPAQLAVAFREANPGVGISAREGRISRVYGRAFSNGATPRESVEAFLETHAGMFGVQPDELRAAGWQVQPIMYQPQTGTYKFTGYFYEQHVDGVPVFGSVLKLLVRNEPGNPLVLAAAGLRDLNGFAAPQIAEAVQPASSAAALQRAAQLSIFADEPQVLSSRRVIWAGVEDMEAAPRLADESIVGVGIDRWRVLTDAVTGEVLFEEHRIYMVDVEGTVEGRVTEGIGAEQCEEEVATPLPYLTVSGPGGSTFTEADGSYVLPNGGTGSVTVDAQLDGQWFDVFNFSGPVTTESETVTPPGPADFLFNADNTDEQVRAQVNLYHGANTIRDFVLQYNPAYPTLDAVNFEATANRTDGFCPQNAWYSPGDPSINFCLSSGSAPNTAWSSVIFHEYGHHLVEAAGSGQCEYGEGMGDVMSVLILDDPNLGWGFFGDCSSPLRDADNSCQYDPSSCTTNCGGPCHSCGQLISGTVWSIRNYLLATEPGTYTDVLAAIVVNSMLVHTGSSISPDIAVDYLTLDDDDADICNGTPHFGEISNGFADHGLFEIDVSFSFPGGLPQVVEPLGGTTVDVSVGCSTAPPEPGTALLHVDTGGGFVEFPMNEVQPNEYEAEFPASTCGDTVSYYFSVETPGGDLVTEPADAPSSSFSAISATSLDVQFVDDFEADQGWTVSGAASDGQWERGTPIPNNVCDRGNPGADADGSGQCYVTDNSSANGCNSDVDSGTTTLTSPDLDATGGDAFVSYWRWYDNTAGSSPNQDTFVIEISGDGGSNWVNLETVGPVNQASGGWFQVAYKVSDFVTPSNQVRVRFNASDTDPQSVVEAGVDGVQVFVAGCEQLNGDVNGDNQVDIDDFLIVLGTWGPCPDPCPPSCAADIDGDCEVGIEDLLIVLATWTL